jgi:hypothetical protein
MRIFPKCDADASELSPSASLERSHYTSCSSSGLILVPIGHHLSYFSEAQIISHYFGLKYDDAAVSLAFSLSSLIRVRSLRG